MLEIVIVSLAMSLVLYAVLGGADFGAGILEIWTRDRKERDVITHAIGPVWEANHIWLILAVVIVFNAFPHAFADFGTRLHIPLTLVLIGIVGRGCAFAFRHYDPFEDRAFEWYTRAFVVSSILTPFLQGMIFAAILATDFAPAENGSFYEIYVAPWANLFGVSAGLFVCALYSFLAGVYLVGETGDPELSKRFERRANRAMIASMLLGAAVFVTAQTAGVNLFDIFLTSPMAIGSVIGAISGIVLLKTLGFGHRSHLRSRILAAAAVAWVVLGWFAAALARMNVIAPALLIPAPYPVLLQLVIALVVGLALVVPALLFLLGTFKLAR